MEIDNSSKPESHQDSLHNDQPGSVSSMTRAQPEYLQCPVCQEYPRREVYQCDDGHNICNECIAKITSCPVCRAIYTQKKIRSRVAETILEGMTFYCSFRNGGCQEGYIPRNRRTAHEIQCEHNPSKPGFNCGVQFNTRACQFRIDPSSIIQDLQHTKDVIEHLTSPLHDLQYKKVEIGENTRLKLFVKLYDRLGIHVKPVYLFEVYDGSTRQTIGYYALILRNSVRMSTSLSWAIVGLNSFLEDSSSTNRHSNRINITFSVRANTDPNQVANDGNVCEALLLTGTIKSTYLDEWKEFMMTRIGDRTPFSFTVPLMYLEKYYKQENCGYEFSVSFGPLVD